MKAGYVMEPGIVEEFSHDGTGWAVFDATRKHRYRLARAVSDYAKSVSLIGGVPAVAWRADDSMKRVVFVMLNPSTADAFKTDPTVAKCIKFAELWGADVLEVVNIFSLRSPYPEDLRQSLEDDRGAGPTNDSAIIAAIDQPNVLRVVAAWGNHGELGLRGEYVRGMLEELREKAIASNRCAPYFLNPFDLCALKKLPNGAPMHPLARGKQFIPLSIEPVPFP